MIAEFIVFMAMAWYTSQVWAAQGITQRWYFCCSSRYWGCCAEPRAYIEGDTPEISAHTVEWHILERLDLRLDLFVGFGLVGGAIIDPLRGHHAVEQRTETDGEDHEGDHHLDQAHAAAGCWIGVHGFTG